MCLYVHPLSLESYTHTHETFTQLLCWMYWFCSAVSLIEGRSGSPNHPTCQEGYGVRGPRSCHPEGKVHITQTGSKGLGRDSGINTSQEVGQGEGPQKHSCWTPGPRGTARVPWVRVQGWVRARICSPSLSQSTPLNGSHPHPSQDKGAIEEPRQGRMPRGCEIQIKGRDPTVPAFCCPRRGGPQTGTPGLDKGVQGSSWNCGTEALPSPSHTSSLTHPPLPDPSG